MLLRLTASNLLCAAFVFFAAQMGVAESIEFVAVDETTNDAWRTSDLPKPDVDGNNVYGTSGYYIAQYANGAPENVLQPLFGTIDFAEGKNKMYEGIGAEDHQAVFDDVLATGPGPVPDLVAGDYWVSGGGATGDEHEFFTITLDEPASFRLGIIVDQTPDNPPGLLWEAARAVRVTGSGGADTGVVDVVGPAEEWRDADVDYALFDVSGESGDIFTVWGVQDERWADLGIGGVTLDLRPPGALGDFNLDGTVDLADFDILAQNFNTKFPIEESFANGDFDLNGIINLDDFLGFRKVFNNQQAVASIPEPGTMWRVLVVGLIWIGQQGAEDSDFAIATHAEETKMQIDRWVIVVAVAAVSIFGSPTAGNVLHSTLDNIDVGDGNGSDSTANGTFAVAPLGMAGGGITGTPGATSSSHLVSGATGQIGQAFVFPGSEEAGVTYGDVHNPHTGGFSASVWFNFDSRAQNGFLASKGNRGSGSEGWSIFYENGNLIYRMGVGGGGDDLRAAVSGPVENDSQWRHAVLVIDNGDSVVRGYLDGSEISGIGFGGPPDETFVSDADGVVNSDAVLLGARTGGGFQFAGLLDDFQLYDVALTSDDVSLINAAGLSGQSFPSPDFNQDGLIDNADFQIMVANFNTSPKVFFDGDTDFNRRIELTDFLRFRRVLPKAVKLSQTPQFPNQHPRCLLPAGP